MEDQKLELRELKNECQQILESIKEIRKVLRKIDYQKTLEEYQIVRIKLELRELQKISKTLNNIILAYYEDPNIEEIKKQIEFNKGLVTYSLNVINYHMNN